VNRQKRKITPKREQEMAVKELLAGRDVMVILPTDFGKRFKDHSVLPLQRNKRDQKTLLCMVVGSSHLTLSRGSSRGEQSETPVFLSRPERMKLKISTGFGIFLPQDCHLHSKEYSIPHCL